MNMIYIQLTTYKDETIVLNNRNEQFIHGDAQRGRYGDVQSANSTLH
jgi:hypothetical protein